jgi:hypothetical protein
MTGPSLRLVANGLENARVARAVILVFPDIRSTSEWEFSDWPQRAHGLVDELLKENAAVRLDWRGEGPQSANLRDAFPKNKIPISEINGFWQRSLGQPATAADDLMRAWIEQTTPDTGRKALLPVPAAEAGLLLPLERARAGLEMLGSDGDLSARTPMRPLASSLSAIGRPWLGRPDGLAKIASIDQNASNIVSSQVLLGPPDVGSWLRHMDKGLDLSGHPYSAYLDADAITRTALGRGDQDLLWLFDRMHALHHAALNGIKRIADAPSVKNDDDSSPAAQRRLQQLLSSPGLMRLFGFARDIYVDFNADLPSRGLGTLEVMPTAAMTEDAFFSPKTSFELIREVGLFYPATRAAYNDGEDPQMKCGVRRLSYKPGGRSIYSIVSIEPVVSADEDLQAQANKRNARVTTGPLALVCCDREAVALEPVYDKKIDYAEELSAPAADRLDIGIDTDDGTVKWYSASPRTVFYRDPHPTKKADREWPQRVIDSLTPSWLPRTERDAGGLMASTYRQRDPDDDKESVECFDPRMAAYNGEAIGARSKSINSDGEKPYWDTWPVELRIDQDLVINQQITVPTQHGGALALMRFGWRYHFGIRRSFLGGAGPTLQHALSLYAKGSDAPFPPVTDEGGGSRYLRHDPITKPIAMLAPDVPVRGKGQRIELQSSAQMVLASRRMPSGGQQIDHTARILIMPSVEAHVAATHEVFDELGEHEVVHDQVFVSKPSKPKDPTIPTKPVRKPVATYAPQQGLKNVRLYYSDAPPDVRLAGHHRFEFGSGEQRTGPYYPDPAACFMVLRLQHPERTDVWLSPPLVVRVRGDAENDKRFSWPNLLPVRVELHRADVREGLKLAGGDIVQDRGQLFRRVTVHLLPGESAVLKAWAAPDAEDLLSWFDVIERSIQLCTAESKDCKCKPGQECATGRQSLLGEQSGPLQGDDDERRYMAGMYHQRLLEEPIFLFADVATINVVHATDVPWHSASFVHTPRVGRPSSLKDDQLTDFLTNAGPAMDWGPAKADDKATAVIVGGTIAFDPSTTSGLVIEAEMLCPGSGVIDPAPVATPAQFVPNPVKPVQFREGKPFFGPRVWTEVLRIQGIPLPADGRAGKRHYALEQLMLGSIEEMRAAQFQYGAPLNTGQAREARFRVVPIPRYAPLLSNRSKELSPAVPAPMLAGLSPETARVWIPATIRPSAPDVKELNPTLTWTNAYVSAGSTAERITASTTRSAALRLVLRRPWFSSGEHERVGIVFWPPAVLDLPQAPGSGSTHEFEVPSSDALAVLTEEDIGPVGPFVSVWGFDPVEAIDPTITSATKNIVRPRFLSADDIVLPDEAIKHPRVLMPLPGATPGKDDERFVAVSVVSFPVTFVDGAVDAYVDLEFVPIKAAPAPVIRIGVVRMQLNARLDEAMTPLVSDPLSQAAIRCSPPVKVQSQILPLRKLSATATEFGAKHGAEGDQTSISVTLSGPAAPYVDGSLETHVTIELVEHIAGAEVAVRTVGGELASNKGTSKSRGRLYREYKAGETTWSTSFLLPGRLAGRQIVARAREDLMNADANDDSGRTRYFGQIAIRQPAIPN